MSNSLSRAKTNSSILPREDTSTPVTKGFASAIPVAEEEIFPDCLDCHASTAAASGSTDLGCAVFDARAGEAGGRSPCRRNPRGRLLRRSGGRSGTTSGVGPDRHHDRNRRHHDGKRDQRAPGRPGRSAPHLSHPGSGPQLTRFADKRPRDPGRRLRKGLPLRPSFYLNLRR